MDEKTINNWLALAEYDRQTAKAMYNTKRYLYLALNTVERILSKYAREIDFLIEPKCIFHEYENHDKASILSETIRTSIDVYPT